MKKIIVTTAKIASLLAGFSGIKNFMESASGMYGSSHRILHAESLLKK